MHHHNYYVYSFFFFFFLKKKEKKEIVAYQLTHKLQGTKTISILGNINQRVDAG